MASYTRDQISRWNKKLSNGFQLDLNRLLMWNEKSAVRNIKLPDGKVLQASIGWVEVRDGFRYTGLVQPEMHLSIWTPTDNGMMTSSGMGAAFKLSETGFPRKVWNELAKFTVEWNDKRIMAEAKKYAKALNNPYIVA